MSVKSTSIRKRFYGQKEPLLFSEKKKKKHKALSALEKLGQIGYFDLERDWHKNLFSKSAYNLPWKENNQVMLVMNSCSKMLPGMFFENFLFPTF